MAVTSIWPIKGRIDTVIHYVINPEKTEDEAYSAYAQLHQIDSVIQYATDELKTEQRRFVAGINCNESTAAETFLSTKEHWENGGGRVCYHGYQSFAKGETDAKTAHDIGIALAERLWGDRFEVLVATHCNTDCYHNHFVINAVSYMDGRKFHNSHEMYRKMREVSDQLCREYGLSVIDTPKSRGKDYSEWSAEKNGKPTVRATICADIDNAILAAATGKEFIHEMESKGYEFKLFSGKGTRLKYPAVRPPNATRFFRFERLGEQYSLAAIYRRIEKNSSLRVPFPEEDRDKVSAARRTYRQEIQHRKATGLYALYLRYCYELRIIQRFPAGAQRVSHAMREDLTKLTRLDEQTLFLGRTGIKTIEELTEYRDTVSAKLEAAAQRRIMLRNDLKRIQRSHEYTVAENIKLEIAEASKEIKELRKEVSLCDAIAARSGRMVRDLDDMEKAPTTNRKEMEHHELFR